MPASLPPLVPAVLQFDDRGLPVSSVYPDIYRPAAGPLQQAHEVFLKGNQLPARWAGKAAFTVCETGFGLGHNFLALWQAWRADADRSRRLHFISFEAHPFQPADLAAYYRHSLDPEAQVLGMQLAQAWPVLTPGIHRFELEGGALTLTLLFGPIEVMARQLEARVDAFFLDGFSPRVNPGMWSRNVFSQLVRVAAKGATAATWCSAGVVRRALQDEGFVVQKVPGFGDKRQMTVATLRPELGADMATAVAVPHNAIVVGAGIAGASVAHALARRGCHVHIFDPALAQGAGGSHAGHSAVAVSPMFNRVDDARARLSRASVLLAWRCWQGFGSAARPARCGTFYPARSDEQAQDQLAALQVQQLPESWMCWLDPNQAAQRVGGVWPYGGVWFAFGQRVLPEPLLQALQSHTLIAGKPERVERVVRTGVRGSWGVEDAAGRRLGEADLLVLANAAGASSLLAGVEPARVFPKLEAVSSVAGQVFYIDETRWPGPRAIVAGHGYALPAVDGRTTIGSTYHRHVAESRLHPDGLLQVHEKMQTLFGEQYAGQTPPSAQLSGWAGWRASVSDRLPVVGQWGNTGLWVDACHASRGFSWSVLAAEMLAAAVFNEPLPLERELRQKMALR